jgi:cell division protease FtsH
VKKFVTDNYTRAQNVLIEHKQKLLDMADALLARETLDADQVRRIAAGLPLDDLAPAAGHPVAPREPKVAKEKERPSIVPPLPPRPVTQE